MNELTNDISAPDGARLHVRVWQSDTPSRDKERTLLLLHGWPNSGRVWQDLAEALLLGGGVRLVAPDLRGFGDSDKPAAGYTCQQFADDVLAVADGLALTGYVLVGHSMSGKVAQLVAARRPANLAGLVLVAPALLEAAPLVNVSGRKAVFGDAAKVRDMLADWVAHPLPGDMTSILVEDALKVGRDAWNGWLSPMRDEDFASEAANIAVPTLVVAGGKDTQRSEDELRGGVVGPIAGAQFAALPGSGHLPHVEEPAALAALLLNFLDGLPQGAGAAEVPTP